jgi:hypothetical protein
VVPYRRPGGGDVETNPSRRRARRRTAGARAEKGRRTPGS